MAEKFTTSIKGYDGDGFDHIVTIGADTPEDLITAATALKQALNLTPRLQAQAAALTPAPLTVGPASQPSAPQLAQGGLVAVNAWAEVYEVNVSKSGKKYAKIKCGNDEFNWQLHGVTAWPEVFARCGIDIEPLAVGEYRFPNPPVRVKVLVDPHGSQAGGPKPTKVTAIVLEGADAQAPLTPEPVEPEPVEDIPF